MEALFAGQECTTLCYIVLRVTQRDTLRVIQRNLIQHLQLD